MIYDLRFVEREVHVPATEYGANIMQKKIVKILQARYVKFCGDASGALCGTTEPTDWQDVPVVTETNNCNGNGEG